MVEQVLRIVGSVVDREIVERAGVNRERCRWMRLVTPALDGHGTRFDPMGGDLSEHRKNPVWLWGHGSTRNALGDPPDPRWVIGRVVDYDQRAESLDVLVEFDTEPFADLVFQKIAKGLLRACSVGAIPIKTEDVEEDGRKVPTFTRWTLKEGSSVIIGSNPEALTLSREAAECMLRALDVETREAPDPTDLQPTGNGVVEVIDDAKNTPAGVTEDAPSSPDVAATPAPAGASEPPPPAVGGPVTRAMGVSGRAKVATQIASVAVVDASGRVLFGKRRDDGRWTLPGGHLEPGEAPIAGAARELAEETRIVVPTTRLAPLGKGRVGDYEIHAFRLDLARDDASQTGKLGNDPDDEMSELRWSGRDDAEILSNLHSPRNVTLRLMGWPVGEPDELTPAQRAARGAVRVEVDTSGIDRVAVALDRTARALAIRGAVAHVEYPLVESGAWDADAATRRARAWASSDGSGDWDKVDRRKYAIFFLGVRGDGESPSDYVLPHHDVQAGKIVTPWRGVVAAAAALQGARGGVSGFSDEEIAAMKRHLAAHYKEFGRVAPWDEKRDAFTGGDLLTRAGDYSAISFTLAPGVKSALRQGLDWVNEGYNGDGLTDKTKADARRLIANGAWWPEKAREARAWFARHGAQGHAQSKEVNGKSVPTPHGVAWALWGGDAGRRQVNQIVAAMERANAKAQARALAALVGPCDVETLARDLRSGVYGPIPSPSYLSPVPEGRDVATLGNVPDTGILTSKVTTMTKMTPEHREAHRALIGHKLDTAEIHGKLAEELPAEHATTRTMHRDYALRALDEAGEMHRCMQRDDATPDDESGEMRAVPAFLKDEDLKRSFSTTYTLVGRLPKTAIAIVRDAFKTTDPGALEIKLAGLVDDRAELQKLRAEAKRDFAAQTAAKREELISYWTAPERAVITPARALEMRGFDPATYTAGSAPSKTPWSPTQIEQYVAERASAGAVAPIVRTVDLASAAQPAPVPGAQPIQPAAPQAPAAFTQSPLIRMGGAQMTVDIAKGAEEMATALRGAGPTTNANAPDAARIAATVQALQSGALRFARPAGDMAPLANAGATGMKPVQ